MEVTKVNKCTDGNEIYIEFKIRGIKGNCRIIVFSETEDEGLISDLNYKNDEISRSDIFDEIFEWYEKNIKAYKIIIWGDKLVGW